MHKINSYHYASNKEHSQTFSFLSGLPLESGNRGFHISSKIQLSDRLNLKEECVLDRNNITIIYLKLSNTAIEYLQLGKL